MSEPLKPRIDFAGPLEADKTEHLRGAQTFEQNQAENFAPTVIDDPLEDEGQAEAVVEAALHPKRSLWRRMVTAGLGIFGISVVAQGVQSTMHAWQTQDWVALGGYAAGALIIGAGVGSVATEWRRLWRLRQRAEERDEARDLLHSHGTGKGRASANSWRHRPGSTNRTRRSSAGTLPFTKRRTTGKWSRCMPISCSRCSMLRRGAKSAVRRQNPR